MATLETAPTVDRGRRTRLAVLALGMGMVLLGVGIAAAGFAYDVAFVNLPYQDAPPALESRWERDAAFAKGIERCGVGVSAVGLGILIVLFVLSVLAKVRRRPSMTQAG
jgi:hypothetical protein